MDFTRKYGPWALITGASEGTGSAFARAVARRGLDCVLIARREAPLAALAAEIRALGRQCVTASVDLARPDAAARVAEAAGGREIGLYIANAGADTVNSRFLDRDIAEWDGLVTLNVLTTMRNCHWLGRAMRARRRGGMILVGSGACYGGLHGLAVYTAAKGFALNFGEALWSELGEAGIDVLSLILGRTDTPAHRRSLELAGQPVPDGMARPEEVARVGLERLGRIAVHNWGEDEHGTGMSPISPAQRQARLLAVKAMSAGYVAKEKA